MFSPLSGGHRQFRAYYRNHTPQRRQLVIFSIHQILLTYVRITIDVTNPTNPIEINCTPLISSPLQLTQNKCRIFQMSYFIRRVYLCMGSRNDVVKKTILQNVLKNALNESAYREKIEVNYWYVVSIEEGKLKIKHFGGRKWLNRNTKAALQ